MVSVVIPVYNSPAELDALLASIRLRCTQANIFEVVVVDDGSVDETISHICARYPFVRLLTLPRNQGASAARNVGARAASYDVLLFLDSDMVVLTDVIDLALTMFQNSKVDVAVGAVSARPMNPGRFNQFWALVKAFSLPTGQYSSTFYPMIGVIRKSVFFDIGGFNEHIKGASIEDYEISLRLEAYRYRVHYNPALLVGTHYKGVVKSLSQSFSRSAKWVLLFWQRRRFDNHTTTGPQAAGLLCGACLVGYGFLVFLGIGSPIFAIGFIGCYVYLTARFYRYVRSTISSWFVPLAVFFHLILSVVVTIGAIKGTLQLLLGSEHRRALLYGSSSM